MSGTNSSTNGTSAVDSVTSPVTVSRTGRDQANLQQRLRAVEYVHDLAYDLAGRQAEPVALGEPRFKPDQILRIPGVLFQHVLGIVSLAVQLDAIRRLGGVAVINALELNDPTVLECARVLDDVFLRTVARVQHGVGSRTDIPARP